MKKFRYQIMAEQLASGKTVEEVARSFGVTKQTVHAANFRARHGKRVAPQEEKATPRVSAIRPIYFIAQQLDKEIVKEITANEAITPVARMALLLTQEVYKQEKTSG